jgi:hypothetical protein
MLLLIASRVPPNINMFIKGAAKTKKLNNPVIERGVRDDPTKIYSSPE